MILLWIRKQWSKLYGGGEGISWPGPWRVIYPNGERTRGLQYGEAKSCQQLWGGKLEYIPETEARANDR